MLLKCLLGGDDGVTSGRSEPFILVHDKVHSPLAVSPCSELLIRKLREFPNTTFDVLAGLSPGLEPARLPLLLRQVNE